MLHRRKTLLARFLVVALTIGIAPALAGCDSTSENETPARLRAVHAAPASGTLDLYVDFSLLAPALGFGEVSPYIQQDAGIVLVEVETDRNGVEQRLPVSEIQLQPGATYTLVVLGRTDTLSTLLVEEAVDAPSTGQAGVQLVHTATGAGSLSFTLLSEDGIPTTTRTGLDFGSVTSPFSVPSGTYTLVVEQTANGFEETFTQPLESDRRYLLLISDGAGNEVDVIVAADG